MIKRWYQDDLLSVGGSYAVCFDPSIRRTGYCVWDLGSKRPVEVGALIVSGNGPDEERLCLMLEYASEIMSRYPFFKAAVEEFQPFIRRRQGKIVNSQLDMMKTSMVQGALYGLCVGRGIATQFVSKGSRPKTEAELVVRSFRFLPTDKERRLDEKDAVHLAWLAFGGNR